MKLKVGTIHDLCFALRALDAPEIKLPGKVRLTVAINLNKLLPVAQAYEQERARSFAALAEKYPPDKPAPAGAAEKAAGEDKKLREKETDIGSLDKITETDLDLDNNHRITSGVLAQLMPILELGK
jgi:hypothetical protein